MRKILAALISALFIIPQVASSATPPPVQYPISVANGGTGSTTAQGALQALVGQPPLYVTNYGAKCDGNTIANVTATAGIAVVSSSSYTFVAGDVGKYITVPAAGATQYVPLNATISSVSAGSATLSKTAGTSVAGAGTATFGTSDSAAIQNAVTAASTSAAGGGLLILPIGKCIISTTIINWPTNVSLTGQGAGKSIMFWLSTSDMANAIINGAGSYGAPLNDVQITNLEMDMSAATLTGYNVAAKGIYFQQMNRALFQNLYVHDAPATCIGPDFIYNSMFLNNTVTNCGRLATSTSAGASGIGVAVGSQPGPVGLGEMAFIGNHIYNAKRFGIFVEESTGNAVDIATRIRIEGNYVNNIANGSIGIGDTGVARAIISGNHVIGSSTTGPSDCISVTVGTITNDPGILGLIDGNATQYCGNGISVNLANQAGTYSSLYQISNNRVTNALINGISLVANGTNIFDTASIHGNFVTASGQAGISLTGAGGFKDIFLDTNVIANNGITGTGVQKSGIYLASNVTRLHLVGNKSYDNSAGTQSYGLAVASGFAVTGALVSDNDFSNNATAPLDILGTVTGLVQNNLGMPTFTLSGACSSTTPVGQGDVGSYLSGTSGTCATTILPYGTVNIIAPNGWSCVANDLTTATDLIGQTASTTTGCTLTGTTVTGDKVAFQAKAF
jgi:hypothetical protein